MKRNEVPSDAIAIVDALMTSDIERVSEDASLPEIAQAMSQKSACVLVCDDAKAVGLISERDLVREMGHVLAGSPARKARDFMSAPVVSISLGVSADEATQKMTSHRIARLVVVDDLGNVAGVVSQTSMVHAHVRRIEEHQRFLEARIAERTAELETANEQLEALSRIDPLMGIGNRRAMEEALAMAHQRSFRYRRTYSVILIDVDHFKAYNDTYGHPRADRVLRDLGREILSCGRMLDTAYRYGGEEVLVLLPETDAAGTLAVADRIRRSVAALSIEHKGAPDGVITVSAGLATSVPSPEGKVPGVFDLLGAADESLYKAKAAGRNRIGPATAPDPSLQNSRD